MSKITSLVCLILLAGLNVFAQNAPAVGKDSLARQPRLTSSSLKKSEGAAMSSATDIVTNIYNSPELNTFYKVVKRAGLDQTFRSKGPITVFAPTNQAFANLSAGKLDSLQRPERKYDMIAFITYHALPGVVTSKDIVHQINSNKGLATLITLTGNKLMAKLDSNHNIVLIDENGGQSVISTFNLGQNNGLIHIVTGVLMPRFKNI
ncbi:fasciclin domain-containing protein [Mucilaginibacter sp. UR6-11]|uniref:fasciclin domain-containing protein n=1 Tax=Mucilaginibacter sp. UR6-11 TaxID=1435644 RepID=UPI001E4B7DD9|nr:fasciclin domain-containing protein [Mucilaginibacter sp. UR6-11]MCC8425849.1 fasciclin domain-containing protein [Mucilaginibacter sp. UR6-11]